MKKLWVVLTAFFLVMALLSPGAYAKSDHAKKSLVALGDSITYGSGLGVNGKDPNKQAFPHLIGDAMDLRVRNLGVPGMTSGELLEAVKSDKTYRDAIRHADYITLNIGGNDLLNVLKAANYNPSGIDPLLLQAAIGSMTRNLNQTIIEIRSLSDAPVAVYNIYNPIKSQAINTYKYVHVLFSVGNELFGVNGINTYIHDVVVANHWAFGDVYFADAFGRFAGLVNSGATPLLPGDNVHPNQMGHQELAKAGITAFDLD
ncbi:GDSL-type esterase/lipase family protein [Alkalihalobacillus sp. AL-G]|uniref:GDSL-type esterase/lipase family protein n=1 Tax=Alkalihalobacillus sp. AL-G TaxID=2926399 RepID=UPI00272A8D09|nr:GDSL-type esterase/lipase family protein [Alkalihalobacillus sp. AL-G]WLD93280.1 GDSL-type esterase/lipase family protein [Alkalihalobacillus sp. AL-G]